MRLKRFALRGLLILFVIVALCMFFARTVQTITTPKVQLVSATTGRLEETMELTGTVEFPAKEEVTISEAAKTPITVGRVYVRPGNYVKQGDMIFTASVPTYTEQMDKMREEYDTKSRELIDLDVQNRTLSKESRQNEMYDAMLDAQDEQIDTAYEARFLALDYDITLTGDASGWAQQLAVYDDVPPEVTQAVTKARKAQSAYETARSAYFEILDNKELRVRSEVFDYIQKRNEALEALEDLTAQMVSLASQVNGLKEVRAQHDGYIVSVDVNEGDVYDGSKKAYVISAAGSSPELSVSIAGISKSRAIADGTRVDVVSDTYGNERSEVIETVTDVNGGRKLRIAMPERFLDPESAAIRRFVADGEVKVNITYRARQSSTLLPPSAVRQGSGSESYVYLIEQNWGGFMSQSSMTVRKTTVTVLDTSDSMVSIAEDLSYQLVADREDRPLADGQKVMEYLGE